jgi:hypothetical protein
MLPATLSTPTFRLGLVKQCHEMVNAGDRDLLVTENDCVNTREIVCVCVLAYACVCVCTCMLVHLCACVWECGGRQSFNRPHTHNGSSLPSVQPLLYSCASPSLTVSASCQSKHTPDDYGSNALVTVGTATGSTGKYWVKWRPLCWMIWTSESEFLVD